MTEDVLNLKIAIKLLAVTLFLVGMIFDLKSRKIPNIFIVTALIFGVSTNFSDYKFLIQFIINSLVVIVIFGHGFVSGYIGAGDLKLLIVAGCWFNVGLMMLFIIITLLTGAFIAVIFIFSSYYKIVVSSNREGIGYKIIRNSIDNLRHNSGQRIPYAVCVFIAFFTLNILLLLHIV